jgi:hypothetical protein
MVRKISRPKAKSRLKSKKRGYGGDNKESSKVQSEFTIPASLDYQEVLKKAREYFYKLDPNVIGVNIAPRRVKKSVRPNEHALVVYVLDKKPESQLDPAKVIPKEFMGLKTDVWNPISADAPTTTVDFVTEHEISDELSAINWVRLHDLAVSLEAPPTTIPHAANVQDFGDICVVQNDGTVVRTAPDGTKYVDFLRAYQLFRTLHGDDYDFVTFFVDSASGVPSVFGTSFFSWIYNDVQGIGVGPRNDRPGWGTSLLQGFHFLNQGHFGIWRYVMLQEFAHQFAAFVRYRDPVTGATMTDHLLDGVLGHWALNLDDDKSPMGYDTNNWVELPSGQFRKVNLNSDERTYCNLDLYLMGLLGLDEVGEFTMLRDVVPVPGSATDFTATPVRLNIQNFIAQEGPRIPNVAAAPKYWRQAFIMLTNDIYRVHDLVDTVDFLRLRWERDFMEATKGLGRIDTVLDFRPGRIMGSDFTVILSVRQHFGNEADYLKDVEPGLLFVGPKKDFHFHCPKVEPGADAVLMFQTRDVDHNRNIIHINPATAGQPTVFGGIPVSPSKDTWNGNIMLIRPRVLRETNNELHIESRTSSGGSGGDIDDFIIDNVVVLYKTR